MNNIAYYNGKIGPIEEMTVPMNERACYFGDGVYDATCVVNGVPLALEDHIDRIYESAKLIEIDLTKRASKQELRSLLLDLISRVDAPVQFLYWQVTRGVGMRNHAFSGAGELPSLWAFSRPHEMRDTYAQYACITLEDTRFLHCNIKSLNLLPSVIATQRAEEAGCAEAILHRGERVTECAHSNVFIIKDGVVRTAPCDNLILPGVTRAHVLAICARKGIAAVEEPFTLSQLFEADEVFFTAASAAACRVTRIDGRSVGGKDEKTYAAIRDAYQEEIKKEAYGV